MMHKELLLFLESKRRQLKAEMDGYSLMGNRKLFDQAKKDWIEIIDLEERVASVSV